MLCKNYASLSLIFAAYLALWPSAAGAENSNSLTFESLLAKALSHSPQFAEQRAELEQIKTEAEALRRLQNPEASAEVRPFLKRESSGETEFEIGLSQPLRRSDFGARQQLAELLIRNSSIGSKTKQLAFAHEFFLLYAKLWAQQERLVYLSEQEHRLHALLRRTKELHASGVLPRSTLKLFEAELAALGAEQEGVFADNAKALAEMIRNTGPLPSNPKFSMPDLPPLPDIARLTAPGLAPEEQIALRAKIAQHQYELARLDTFPQLTPRIAVERNSDGDTLAIVGLSVQLPVFNQNQAEIAAARSAQQTANSYQQNLTSGSHGRTVTLLHQSCLAAERQAERQRTEVLPLYEEAYAAAEQEMFSGHSSATSLWQIVQQLEEAHRLSLEQWLNAVSLRTELALISGVQLY